MESVFLQNCLQQSELILRGPQKNNGNDKQSYRIKLFSERMFLGMDDQGKYQQITLIHKIIKLVPFIYKSKGQDKYLTQGMIFVK